MPCMPQQVGQQSSTVHLRFCSITAGLDWAACLYQVLLLIKFFLGGCVCQQRVVDALLLSCVFLGGGRFAQHPLDDRPSYALHAITGRCSNSTLQASLQPNIKHYTQPTHVIVWPSHAVRTVQDEGLLQCSSLASSNPSTYAWQPHRPPSLA